MARPDRRQQAAGAFKMLVDTDVKYGRDDVSKAVEAVKSLPIELPAGGHYQVRARGRELHIEETSSGIQRFRTTDPSRITGTDYNGDTIEIGFKGRSFDTIVLHTAPAPADPRAVLAGDAAIVPYLEEYERIKAKPKPTGKDAKRLIELIEKYRIHEHASPDLDGNLPSTPERAARDNPAPRPSGESRGYTSSPESRGAAAPRPSAESRGASTSTTGESRGVAPSGESRGFGRVAG